MENDQNTTTEKRIPRKTIFASVGGEGCVSAVDSPGSGYLPLSELSTGSLRRLYRQHFAADPGVLSNAAIVDLVGQAVTRPPPPAVKKSQTPKKEALSGERQRASGSSPSG